MDFTDILYEKADRIATVTMNRPDKMNAWTPKMGAEIRQAMLDAERDDNVGAIILTGAGRAYCAGADMGMLSEISRGRVAPTPSVPPNDDFARGARPDYQTQYSWMLALRKPVIGAINGACVGLGFTYSLYQDIRIASDKARMGLIFVQRGLAIEHGSSWMLPRIIGVARAMELAVTGRLIDANEAQAMGLVHRVVPHDKLMETAREVAGHIANKCTPLGVGEVKKMIYEHLFTDLATAIKDENALIERMTKSEDFAEGIKAFMEKRSPRFKGR